MNSPEPGSPTSLSGLMGNLSISPPLTAKSEEVKLFTVLFTESIPNEQNFYIDQFFEKISDNLLKRYYDNDAPKGIHNRTNAINCVKQFLTNPKTNVCTGFSSSFGSFKLFEAYRDFLDDFKFPPFSSTMSLPQLQLLSMLIFSNSEPESLSTCNFMVNSVDFGNTSNIQYERGKSKSTKNVTELLDFLQHIGINNNVITNNFKLGKMSKPANIPRDIEARKAIKFNKTFLFLIL